MNVSFDIDTNKFQGYIEEIFRETEHLNSFKNGLIDLSISANKRDITLFNDETVINLHLSSLNNLKAEYEVESKLNDVFKTISLLDLFEPNDELIEGMFEYIYNLIQDQKRGIA